MERNRVYRKAAVIITLVFVLGIGSAAGWLAYRSMFLAGALVGLCAGSVLGFLVGVIALAVYASESPEKFLETFKKVS